MPELNRELFVSLWKLTKAQQTHEDPDLARMQKYMVMHEDMHPHFDQIEQDPAAPIDVEGENLPLHIFFDAAAEKALELDRPAGIRALMQQMLDAQLDPGVAFHVVSQAIAHESIIAMDQGREEVDEPTLLARATQYAQQAGKQ